MTARAEVLERDRQIAELCALLEEARRGEGRVALVSGEAGIGKTALIHAFTEAHVAPPVRLLWGGCDALFTPRPLAPLQEVAWVHGGKLAERLGQGATRDEVFQTFFDELRYPRPPAVVVIEDVHWADEATLDLLRFLGRRVERASALLVITWRDEEVGPAHPLPSVVGDLSRRAARRILLPPLSAAAVESLARRAHHDAHGLHQATGGNPFFVTEVLASEAPGVPATVRDAVLARALRLSPAARELLDLASVVPTRIDQPLLAAAAGPASAALEELLEAGMLTLSQQTVAFRHELARQAVEGALPPLRARALHARMFAAMQAGGERPELLWRLVHHAAGAADVAAVLELAPEAARHAARLGAHREAAAHLATALRHGADLPIRRRAELLEARSYECSLTDRMKDGIADCTAALELYRQLGDATREGNCLRRLSRLCWYSARSGDARRHAGQAVEVLEPLPPGPELAMAWSNRAALHMLDGEAEEARRWGEKALRLGRERGCAEVEAHALNNLGCAAIQLGDEEGWALLEETRRLSLLHGFQEHAARAYANLGSLAVEERRYPIALGALDAGVDYAEERDIGTLRLCALAWRARLRVETGRWAEAAADAAAVLDDRGGLAMTRLAALTPLAVLRLRRGDPGARAALDEARDLARQADSAERMVPVAVARAEMAWLEADPGRALSEAREALPFAERTGRVAYLSELAVWIWRGGGTPPAAARLAAPWSLQVAGDWRAASAAFEALGCRYEAALACCEAEDAEAVLNALELLEGLEARPAAARLRRRLAELGVRRIPRGPRAARREHPFDLTAREQEVLEALARGLSNAEIGRRLYVSAKTVDYHVSAVLAKLGVKSRGAAVAAARDHGLLEPEGRLSRRVRGEET